MVHWVKGQCLFGSPDSLASGLARINIRVSLDQGWLCQGQCLVSVNVSAGLRTFGIKVRWHFP